MAVLLIETSRTMRLNIALRLYALTFILIGLSLLGGGGYLLLLGGSDYYLLAGGAVLASGAMLWRRSGAGALIYAWLLLVTLPWAVWEAGWDVLALTARLLAPVVLGLPLLLPAFRKQLTSNARVAWAGKSRTLLGAILLVSAACVSASMLRPPSPLDPIHQTGDYRGSIAAPRLGSAATAAEGDWLNYGNDPGGTRFSPLTQINAENVRNLQSMWTFHVGKTGGLEVTPIKVERSLYLCTSDNDVIALDAETGKQRWRYNIELAVKSVQFAACRGVAYYKIPNARGLCAARILTNTRDARLLALDAETGRRCPEFGENGEVNLLTGLVQEAPGLYTVTSAPTVVRGKVLLGGYVADGQYWGEPSGVVRAFDAVSGSLAWALDVGALDRQTLGPGETYTHSTPNAWAPFSFDEALGLVYLPTGNPAIDYFGGRRRAFDEQYGSSVIAVDADSGRIRWSFQTTHHDLWDYDVASQPTLVDIPFDGVLRHSLIQATKRGEIFVLDRETGIPLTRVQEQPAPMRGAVPEERLAATQPFSVAMPSFRGPDLNEHLIWGVTPLDQLWCRIRFREARYEGVATPPGLQPNIAYPGYNGGIDWGGVSVDVDRKLLFVNSNRFANYDRLKPHAAAEAQETPPGNRHELGGAPQRGAPYAADIQIFWSPLGIPCNEPPYGMIAAVDLPTGRLLWSKPFGNIRANGPLGLRSMLPLTMGVPNNGGSVATRSGLLFIGATVDGDFRAFEGSSGNTLWHVRLPAGGQATPMTYISPESGRQFVVIAAGGHPAMGSVSGDYIVGYALPK
jgi:quinoprotein glucose dehydrogenase